MQLKLLITEHFLTTLAAGHAFLLGLTGLRRRKLLLLLLFDNLCLLYTSDAADDAAIV